MIGEISGWGNLRRETIWTENRELLREVSVGDLSSGKYELRNCLVKELSNNL